MRELRKVFNPVSGMKSEKDIEKGYRKIVSEEGMIPLIGEK